MTRLITLDAWIALRYAEGSAPTRATAQRWAKTGKIKPAPEKHGTRWYVLETARYTASADDDIVERLRSDYATHAAPSVTH